MLQAKLAELPEELQRELFMALHLEICYDARLGVALIRITLDYETIESRRWRRNFPETKTGACRRQAPVPKIW